MPQTPDRSPLPREEEKLHFTFDEGYVADAPGDMVFNGTSFQLRDSAGAFDPRSGGSGITEAQHEALDTIVHDIDESSYDEVTYGSGNLVSTYIVWETAAKLKKIREEQYTYSGSKVSQSVTIQYDGTGAVKMTVTETYTYSGSRVTSVTRTKS